MTAKTSVDSPGYPVDLSLSDNGQLMAVSYLCVKNNQPASFMAFYNFGYTGQTQMDNQVSGYNYVGTLIPQVDYLSDAQALAFSDDGFLTYSGKQIPEEDLDNVWIKFYKVDKARTREYGGSGIGLSIVKAIMESFHRECGVLNHEDGVEFWFELDTEKTGIGSGQAEDDTV